MTLIGGWEGGWTVGGRRVAVEGWGGGGGAGAALIKKRVEMWMTILGPA